MNHTSSSQTSPIRIAMCNPYVSDDQPIVGSFRTEEMCSALAELGVEGVVTSPFLNNEHEIADGFQGIPLPHDSIWSTKAFLRAVRGGHCDLIQERPYSRGIFRIGYGAIASIDTGITLVIELHSIGTRLSSLKRLHSYLLGLRTCAFVLVCTNLQDNRIYAANSDEVISVPG